MILLLSKSAKTKAHSALHIKFDISLIIILPITKIPHSSIKRTKPAIGFAKKAIIRIGKAHRVISNKITIPVILWFLVMAFM